MTEFRQHQVTVQQKNEPIHLQGRPKGSVQANLYRTGRYAVLDVGLPRCRPEHIQVYLGPNAILVEAELHLGQEALEQEREYLIAELPYGRISRVFPLPWDDLELPAGEAHFQNGLLTVTIPTHERDAYLRRMR